MTNSKLSPVNFLLAAAFVFGMYAFYCFWMIQDDKTPIWGVLYTIGAGAYLVCLWAIFRRKSWAVGFSYALMLAAFGFGVYLVHFVWTFWIFEKPTLTEKILNALNPRVSAFIIFPVIWLAYFIRRGNKV